MTVKDKFLYWWAGVRERLSSMKFGRWILIIGLPLLLIVCCVGVGYFGVSNFTNPAWGAFGSYNHSAQTDVAVRQTSDALWLTRTAAAVVNQSTPTPTASLPATRTNVPTLVGTQTPVPTSTTTQVQRTSTSTALPTVVSAAPIATFPATGWNPSGIDLTLIEAREQVGGGMDIIGDWTNPNLSRQIVVNPLDRIAIVPISSDKGIVKVYKADGTLRGEQLFSKGFIYVIALDPGDWFEVTGVGYNIENGHRNTWCEAFVFPSDPTPADLAQILQEWQDREKKPQAASLWINNTITWLANN